MAERKATNKYYPPEWDPSKGSINKYVGQHPYRDRARKLDQGILIVRFELPYNILCEGCNNYISQGNRYNAEKKKIGMYYSTPIFSFRMKCHLCSNWIEIHTDPKNTEYVIVSGARRKIEEWDAKENGSIELIKFQYLLERSQQLFAGLRDLPPTGSQKQWQPYFKRTFEVYTKLWKYQQQHRAVLENKEYYGLKRVEIGEIASKIAQLYYHYYLRTSETNYLQESCIFYQAIHERNYFKETSENKSSALMIKKLRYYARFIVVCLLLNHYETIKQLMEELNLLVDEYTKIFKPSDAAEWNVVITEISNFLEADKKLLPTDLDGHMLSVSSRLSIDKTPKLNKDGTPKLKLQEAILVGNHQNQ
eukprot:jgi/Orpsp1_1/1191088/evm.model.d7180000083411.1